MGGYGEPSYISQAYLLIHSDICQFPYRAAFERHAIIGEVVDENGVDDQ